MTTLKRNWPETLTGFGLIIIGLVIAWQASTIKVIALYAKVGPAAFLWFVAVTLILCGAVVMWRAPAPSSEPFFLAGPLAIIAGLVQTVILFEPFGFIISCTLLFFLTAWGLGSRAYLRTLLIGLILSTLAYCVFRYVLDLRLPAGDLFT